MAQQSREYELILLGATGYTGKLVAEWVTTHLPDGDELCDERFSKSLNVIQKRNRGPAMHITTTQADGSKTMTAII